MAIYCFFASSFFFSVCFVRLRRSLEWIYRHSPLVPIRFSPKTLLFLLPLLLPQLIIAFSLPEDTENSFEIVTSMFLLSFAGIMTFLVMRLNHWKETAQGTLSVEGEWLVYRFQGQERKMSSSELKVSLSKLSYSSKLRASERDYLVKLQHQDWQIEFNTSLPEQLKGYSKWSVPEPARLNILGGHRFNQFLIDHPQMMDWKQ